jgi:phospholipase/carboxylesterase
MPITKTNFGGLTTYVVSEIPEGERPELAVVLCHGYGATGRDLIGLTEAIGEVHPSVLARTVFLYPAGPLDLAPQGIPYGRGWWHIDLDRLLNHPTAELLMQFRRGCPDGLPAARELLLQLIAEAGHGMGLSPERFVLGGFSQGAMLTTDVALRMEHGPAALCILSGALINETQWRGLAPKHSPFTILQTHGRQDPILMYPQATALRDLLQDSGHKVEFVPFEGYHEIPAVVVERMAEVLERCLRSAERA